MVTPLGRSIREAAATVREAADKTSAWVKLALALSVAALTIAAFALVKAAA